MSGLLRDWDWHVNPGYVDLEVLRNVKSALNEGRNVLVTDTNTYSRATQDDELTHIGNAKSGSILHCLALNAPCYSAHRRIRCVPILDGCVFPVDVTR